MLDESRIRSRKKQVEDNSVIIERLVKGLVQPYINDLDEYLHTIKRVLDSDDMSLSDDDIEDMALRVPVYMYFVVEGVEVLGIQGDNSKALRMETYNKVFISADGTVKDKEHTAELNTIPEYLLEVAYIRAYKIIKTKLDAIEHICSATRKVLGKRMQSREIGRMRLEGDK